jgi:hypothetical protein
MDFLWGTNDWNAGNSISPTHVEVHQMTTDDLSQLMAGMPMIYLGKPDNSTVILS